MKKIILFILIISGQIFTQNVLTVEEAIRTGLQNNYDIRLARNNSEIASNNRTKGISGFLPTVDISGNTGYADSKKETNSPFSFGDAVTTNWAARINLSWTIFDGLQMFANNSRYLELEKLGKSQARIIIENNVVAIMRGYYNLVLQTQLFEISNNSLEISRQRFEKMKVRNDLGVVSSTDLLNAQVAFNSDNTGFINQKLNVEIARKNLNLLLGVPADSVYAVSGVIDYSEEEFALDELYKFALEKNSSLNLAVQNIKIAESGVTLSNSSFLPRIMLTSGYEYSDVLVSASSRPDDISTQSTDGTIGLSFSFNLFNGFRDNVNRQNSQIELENSKIAYVKEEQNLRGNLIEKLEGYKNKITIAGLEEQNVKAAEQNLQLWIERLETGAVNSLEFRDAQNNYIRAKSNYITARYAVRIAKLEIEQLIGAIRIEN